MANYIVEQCNAIFIQFVCPFLSFLPLVYLSLYFCLFRYLSISACICLCLSLTVSVTVCVSLFVFVCLYFCLWYCRILFCKSIHNKNTYWYLVYISLILFLINGFGYTLLYGYTLPLWLYNGYGYIRIGYIYPMILAISKEPHNCHNVPATDNWSTFTCTIVFCNCISPCFSFIHEYKYMMVFSTTASRFHIGLD